MDDLTPDFIPYSDVCVSDLQALDEHRSLIDQYQYTEATDFVQNDASLERKGFRSSFFNAIEHKIQELQIYLLNKNAEPEDYYSLEEPAPALMNESGKQFWIKPIE